MSRLPAEKHIAADPARTGIVEPVPNTAVIFEIRNLGVIPISIMEDRRLDIQTLSHPCVHLPLSNHKGISSIKYDFITVGRKISENF